MKVCKSWVGDRRILFGGEFDNLLREYGICFQIYGWLTRRERENDAGRYSLILSLFSCFAGGVFLAVCFLDMLPDAM
jgi:hypothetical protein